MMKRLFIILAFIICAAAVMGQQHYKPSLHAGPQNKPSGISSATPLDSRSYFYDTLAFAYRPYANRAEVLSYLYLASYRSGQFTIIIDSASHKWAYWFRDGTADNNLVLQYNFAAATTDSTLFATRYYVDTAKVNLRNSIAGKLSTTLPSGQILVGNFSNIATPVTPNNDVSVTTGGSFTVLNQVRVGDSAAMLTPYLRKIDTTNKWLTGIFRNPGNDSVFYIKGGVAIFAYLDSTSGSGGGGITTLNGLSSTTQLFAIGVSGVTPNIASVSNTHTFNFPIATLHARGVLDSTDWGTFNSKLSNITGLVTPGTNISVTGSGTAISPYVITATAGSGINQLNGDVFAGPGIGNQTATLASVTSAGSCTNCSVTFDVKGRATTYGSGSSGGSTVNTTFLGNIYNKKTAWSSLADFTQSGSTFTTSSSNIVVTNGTAGFVGNEIAINYGSCLEKWTESVRFIVTSSSGSSGGLALGMLSTGAPTINAFGRLYLSGANTGKVELDLQSNTQYAISSGNLTYSNGDTLLLSVNRDRELITVFAQNITTKSARVEAGFVYAVSGTPAMPNTGNFCVYNMGGTQTLTIDSINVNSTAVKGSSIYFLGNSKTEYSVLTAFQNSFVSRFGQNFSVINGGGIGDQTAQMVSRLPEIINLAPQYVVLADLMSNDQRNSVSSGTYQANYQAIHDTLRAHGIKIIHASPFYETSINLSGQQTYVNSTFPTDTIVNCYDPLRVTANILAGDGIHPNDLGDSILYNAMVIPFKISGAGRVPPLFGEGVATQVPVWSNTRQISGSNMNFQTNTLNIPGHASMGDFKAYTQAPVWIGNFPAGQPTMMMYQAGAGVNQKISRLWNNSGTLEFDYFKDDTSGVMPAFMVTGTGTLISNITLAAQSYINRTTGDGALDATGLMVGNGISTSTLSAKDVFIGVVGNYDHYVGYGRLSTGNPYWYENNLGAGTNQKLWDGNYDATGVFTLRALTDGAGGATPIYNIDRSAYPAIKFNFQTPVLLNASSTTAGTSAIKFLAGSPPTTPETGAMNFNTGLWIIDSSTSKRDTIATRSWVRNTAGSGGTTTPDTLHVTKKGSGLQIGYTNGADTLFLKSLAGLNSISVTTGSDSTNNIQLVHDTAIGTAASYYYGTSTGGSAGRLGYYPLPTANNIYTADGTLTADRVVSGGNFNMQFGSNASKFNTVQINANAGITFHATSNIVLDGGPVYVTATTSDAAYTVGVKEYYITLIGITANRVVTLPTSPLAGRQVVIRNSNTTGNVWSFSPSIIDGAGNTITNLVNGTVYNLIYDSTNWVKVN